MRTLSTTDEVIDALGGNTKLGQILGHENGDTVSTYRGWYRGKFPAKTYIAIQRALAEIGATAPDSLWNMSGPTLPATQSAPLQGAAR